MVPGLGWSGEGKAGGEISRTVNHDSHSWHPAKLEGNPRWAPNDIFRNDLLRILRDALLMWKVGDRALRRRGRTSHFNNNNINSNNSNINNNLLSTYYMPALYVRYLI